ncbi:hypothetical protein DTO169C6_4662 [Paecilomyces variotii]|nr:hypothetical protein DTO169C6_4662 [Paecilomyces variotii]KAJ9361034.1 hypothetical protein DTO027B9_883 [Paecilomyces variotii]
MCYRRSSIVDLGPGGWCNLITPKKKHLLHSTTGLHGRLLAGPALYRRPGMDAPRISTVQAANGGRSNSMGLVPDTLISNPEAS